MAAIRAAYRNLMRRFHPDVNRSDDAAARATAINEAYACLSDEARRAAYDEGRFTRETIYQPRTTSRPRRSPRPDWSDYPAFSPIPEPEPQPIPVRFAILGLAVLVTLITFTITSAVAPVAPPPAAVTEVETLP